MPIPCGVAQACNYVTLLSDELSHSSILTYYQAVIFMHVCVGLEPVRLSNPILNTTLNGIKRSQGLVQKGKDPLFPHHLRVLYNSLNRSDRVETLVFTAALLLFRTLLRVSHVVCSDHTLTRGDVKFNREGCLLRIRSSKTSKGRGSDRYIPLTWASDAGLCPARALRSLLSSTTGRDSDPLLSADSRTGITYSVFSKKFKNLINRSGLVGDFASHSLRRGGATYMSMVGCTVPQVKERGGWASDCVFRYIKPSFDYNVMVDKKFASHC